MAARKSPQDLLNEARAIRRMARRVPDAVARKRLQSEAGHLEKRAAAHLASRRRSRVPRRAQGSGGGRDMRLVG